jgi:MFS family permease
MELPGRAADANVELPSIASELEAAPSRWRINTFRSLRHRNYRLYFIGQVISMTGTWMQNAALSLLAYDLTHLAAWPARITAAQLVPLVVLGLWGGELADRKPKRTIIILAQSGMLLIALVLAAMVATGQANPWPLLVIATLNGIIGAIDLPARLAFVMDMVGREDLPNAVALNSLMFNVARVLGPALGALTYVAYGPAQCFLFNALSYVAVLIGLWMMDVDGRPAKDKGRRRWSLGSGFRYLGKHRRLLLLLLLSCALSLFGWPTLALMPALANARLYAKEFLAAIAGGAGAAAQTGWTAPGSMPALAEVQQHAKETYGLLVSAVGVGALLAALLVASFSSRGWQKAFLAAGVTLTAVGLAGLGFVESVVAAAACCTVLGLGLILFFPTGQAIMQLGATDENRGAIMGIWTMALGGAVPLGVWLAGEAADFWGVSTVFEAEAYGLVLAAMLVLIASFFWRNPAPVPGK